jgi:hypothetical protein
LLLTEVVADPQEAAESLKTALIEFIKSGRLYNRLVAVGIFPGLIGIEVSTCCSLHLHKPLFVVTLRPTTQVRGRAR